MQKKTVLDYFWSVSETCKALGITRQYVGKWPDKVPKDPNVTKEQIIKELKIVVKESVLLK